MKRVLETESKLCANCGREFWRKRFNGKLEGVKRWAERTVCSRNCHGQDSLFENKVHYEAGEAWISLPGQLWARCDIPDVPMLIAAVTRWLTVTFRGKVYARGQLRSDSSKGVLMHCLILPGVPEVDHQNGNGLDNRRRNLRSSTRVQNCRNTKSRGGSSRFKGVSFCHARKRWEAKIKVNGRTLHLGRFKQEVNAAQAYNFAADEYFGEFAVFNV